jgi:hypothetical protein
MTIFFGCFGGKAAKTTELHAFFRPAGGQKASPAGAHPPTA